MSPFLEFVSYLSYYLICVCISAASMSFLFALHFPFSYFSLDASIILAACVLCHFSMLSDVFLSRDRKFHFAILSFSCLSILEMNFAVVTFVSIKLFHSEYLTYFKAFASLIVTSHICL